MYRWREKLFAPAAVVAIHQAGAAIDQVREPIPTDAWMQAKTYTTYAPAVILGAWGLMSSRVPVFLDEMMAPAITIGLDDLGARAVTWVTKKQGTTTAAVAEANRIIAEARARGTGARGKGAPINQPIARDEELLA